MARLSLAFLLSFGVLACGGSGTSSSGGGGTPSPPPLSTGYRGVFALGQQDVDLPSDIYANPNVDGVALRASWAAVEPSEGSFNFSELDGQVSAAGSAHKSVSLSVTAGIETPSWVYEDGAGAFTTVVDAKYSPQFCSTSQIPIPWDPVFLAKWTAFIQALGTHYSGNAAISKVHITGVNFHTEETGLPAETGGVVTGLDGSPCQTNNDVQEWQQLGYTGNLVKNAWMQMTQALSAAFPGAKIIPMVHPGAFPPIDDSGQPDSSGAQLQRELLSAGLQAFGAQFGAQNNGLSQFFVDPEVSSLAPGTTTGYQMLWFVTNDSTCRMNKGNAPCDPHQDLAGAIAAAVGAGATYLEIYKVDILNPALADVIAQAHSQLVP
jgi:hypothetical protein